MNKHNYWNRAFVLHHRPFSETSLLVDIFSENNGRLTLLAKGARRTKSPWKSVLQPFTPLLMHWTGNGAVKTLIKAETASLTLPMQNKALYSGFYLNEILCRLLAQETAQPEIFQDYLNCLTQLAGSPLAVEVALRTFEFRLVRHLGYGIDFSHCVGTGKIVEENMRYRYLPEEGFLATAQENNQTFWGKDLLAFERLDFSDPNTLVAAKRFSRLILKNYLGDAPLKSRELFTSLIPTTNLKIK